MPIVTFPIRVQWKLQVAIVTKVHEQDNKNIASVEANVMNISAKFQLYPPYGL